MTVHALPLYFHGLPGGALELNLFGAEVMGRCSHFAIAQRDFPQGTAGTDRFTLMAEAVRLDYPNRPLRLIGFSLGAAAALRVASLLGSQVERIDLISAAAPLNLGDYLGNMAGGSVFRCARDHPTAFHVLARSQSFFAGVSPKTLFSVLFRTAVGADISLRDDPRFQAGMTQLLSNCLVRHLDVYRLELQAYVEDWSQMLKHVTQPVNIFHGRSDNWSPVEMAFDLAANLQNCESLEILDDYSHYSALNAFLLKH